MIGTVLKAAGERAGGCAALIAAAACFLWFADDMRPAVAQAAPTAEETRLVEFGKEIFKSNAVCHYCHKWDASSDQAYRANTLSLLTTPLPPHHPTARVK